MTDCAICFSEVSGETGRTVMSCGHEFHMRCLFQWLQKPDGSGNCPCCRREPTEHERLVAAPADDESDYDSDDDSDAETVEGTTPLMQACLDGVVAAVSALLATATGADLEARDSDGDTALTYAAMQSNTEIVRLLLDAGANMENRGMLDMTPLMRALDSGEMEAARLLAERGANCQVESERGDTVLTLAAESDDVETLQMVLERGVRGLGNALHAACAVGARETALALLEAGADPNARLSGEEVAGRTPLMSAVGGEDPDWGIVDALIAKCADVNATDDEGANVFMYMTRADGAPDPDIMASLLDAMATWKRGSDGRWSQVMQTWGHGDASPPPFTLAEETRAAATRIQAVWRGYCVRRPAPPQPPADALTWVRLQITIPRASATSVSVTSTPAPKALPPVPAWWDQRFSRVL